MDKTPKVSIDKENEQVTIENLTISSSDTFNFLKDKQNPEDWATKAIIIGCVGLKQMVLTENIDFVEKEFNSFIAKAKETFEKQAENINDKIESTFSLNNTQSPLFQMKELINEYFDKDNGQIKSIIDETFNLDNKKSALSQLIEELKKNSEMDELKLSELLDPNRTDSPTRQLKDQILEKLTDIRDKEIKDIRDQLLREEAIISEKQKGTSKGFDFEEKVYLDLQKLASYYENTVELTGNESGVTVKKGDVVIELENKKKITIECKDSSGYSSKKCLEEIKGAIINRKASYGIFIFASRDEMPKELCPIKITDKYLITYYDEDKLYFAYRLARLFALKEDESSSEEINFEEISSELNTLEENFRNIDMMQVKATSIINSGEYIKTNLKTVREGLEESIVKIKKVLGKKYSDDSLVK
jgi:hypothetical protein